MVADNVPPLFHASTRSVGTWRILQVAGELDMATAPQLQEALIKAMTVHDQPPSLILDLTDVGFCDASGLRVLVAAQRSIQRRHGRLRLICPEGRLLRILRIAQLPCLLLVYPTLDRALNDDAALAHRSDHGGSYAHSATACRHHPA